MYLRLSFAILKIIHARTMVWSMVCSICMILCQYYSVSIEEWNSLFITKTLIQKPFRIITEELCNAMQYALIIKVRSSRHSFAVALTARLSNRYMQSGKVQQSGWRPICVKTWHQPTEPHGRPCHRQSPWHQSKCNRVSIHLQLGGYQCAFGGLGLP